jgi:phytoene desaturase
VARILVVGAGMGGLAVAARLAARRHEVTVLEQAPTVGGKLGSFSRDGFTFDTGPSLLTLPAVYRDLFRSTGSPLEDVVELVEVDPVCHYRFADGTWLDVPNVSRPRIRQALDGALGTGAGRDWDRLLERGQRIWQATRTSFLEAPVSGPADLARMAHRFGDLRAVAPWHSLRGLGRGYLRDPRLRVMLDRYATYAGSDPRRAPAALAVIPYVETAFGAWYVRGGLHRLAAALADRAVERGVRVRTGAEVIGVVAHNGRVTGVRLADGSGLTADVVVSDVDAAHLYGDLLADAPRQERARARRAARSLSGFVLLLALRGRSARQRHHMVLFPGRYDAEFDAIFGTPARPVADPAIYVAAPDDPATRPDDNSEAWFVLVNAPPHLSRAGDPRQAVDWDADGLGEAYADHVLDAMAARGVDVRDRIRWREVRTPADLGRATHTPSGAIYGAAGHGVRGAFLRPANRSPVPGLFLVGGSAHPGGGLPLVGLSAAIVADLIGPA